MVPAKLYLGWSNGTEKAIGRSTNEAIATDEIDQEIGGPKRCCPKEGKLQTDYNRRLKQQRAS
jgi:hypothetical protein